MHHSEPDKSFEETLAQILLTVEDDASRIDAAAKVLGCRSVTYDALTANAWTPELPAQPEARHEHLVYQTLLQLIHANSHPGWQTDVALLDGLIRHERWKTFITNTDDALAFAGLLVKTGRFFAWLERGNKGAAFRECMIPEVCSILNAWCAPDAPFETCPTAEDITKHLFGDAWYSIAVEGAGPVELPGLIQALRPPFRYGTLPAGFDSVSAVDLPPSL